MIPNTANPAGNEEIKVRTSESINELAAALAAAQGAFTTASKNAENPHLRNKFADLGELIRATRPALAANGLAVIQSVAVDDGFVDMTTTLCHASGQWVTCDISAPVGEQRGVNPLQAIGVTTTYLRRYSYSALVCVVGSDDIDTDGEQAAPTKTQPQPQQKLRPAPEPAQAPTPAPDPDPMPQARFEGYLPTIVEMIRSGRSTVERVAQQYAARGLYLTEAQLEAIRAEVSSDET